MITDVLLGWVVPLLCCAVTFALGWIWRGVVDRRRREKAIRLRRITNVRTTVAREGTTPAIVRQARLERGYHHD